MTLTTEYRDAYSWIGEYQTPTDHGDPVNRPHPSADTCFRQPPRTRPHFGLEETSESDDNVPVDKSSWVKAHKFPKAPKQTTKKRSGSAEPKTKSAPRRFKSKHKKSHGRRYTFDPARQDFRYKS